MTLICYHYFYDIVIFLKMKLKNLYIKIGTGTSTRYLPVHELANILGEKQCRKLSKAHITTSCDWLSKLGTKSNTLHKVDLLDSFGESDVIDSDLINLLKNISFLYWKEKMYPLKRSMSTDIINMLRVTHQFSHWFHLHTVFEMGI